MSERPPLLLILKRLSEPVGSMLAYWILFLLLTSWPTEETEDFTASEARGGYQEGGLPGGEASEGEVVIGLAPAFEEPAPEEPAPVEPPALPPEVVVAPPPVPAAPVPPTPPAVEAAAEAPPELPPVEAPPETALEPPAMAELENGPPDPFAELPVVFDPEAAPPAEQGEHALSEEEAAAADAALETEAAEALGEPSAETDAAPLQIRYGRPTTASRTVGVVRKQAAAERIAKRASKKAQQDCLPDDPRITEVGKDDYELSHELVEYYTSHMNQAMKLAATYWHKDAEGKIDGFTVRRMRCGSTLHQLGFRNGDVIQAINGKKIQSISSALAAFRRTKRKEVIRVDISRKGEPIRLRYRIT